MRGNTVRSYEWLASLKTGTLPDGPPVWICGDCHLCNLGPVANAAEHVEVQIRDLDQTVIGNPSHDLIRLGLSLASAARGSNLPRVTMAKMLEAITAGSRPPSNTNSRKRSRLSRSRSRKLPDRPRTPRGRASRGSRCRMSPRALLRANDSGP